MRVPRPVAHGIGERVLQLLRGYFVGMTLVAAFNGIVGGVGALLLGVPLAGTIAGGSLFGTVGLILAAPLTSAATRIATDLARNTAPHAARGAAPAA